jgi:hypothetical protein
LTDPKGIVIFVVSSKGSYEDESCGGKMNFIMKIARSRRFDSPESPSLLMHIRMMIKQENNIKTRELSSARLSVPPLAHFAAQQVKP